MSYTNTHILLRAHGAFGTAGGAEKWSAGLRFAVIGTDVPLDPAALEDFVEAAHPLFQNFNQGANMGVGNDVYFTHATGARIGTDGKYSPLEQDTVVSSGAPIAGQGVPVQPWTAALVVSLRTNLPRGYASNGRFYWPATAQSLGAGRVTAAYCQGRADAADILFTALNAAAAAYVTGLKLAVMSAVGSGRTAHVTHVRVDDRLDNIERRENATPPVYYSATL